ncbi:MAG: hypothetical protein WC775_05240 [Patescibacteria group bacterium]|jgi:hypothetical protein
MDNKKLIFAGGVGFLFVVILLFFGFTLIQNKSTVKNPPAPTIPPTTIPLFPSNIVPKVPTATPIPTITTSPQVTPGPSPDTRPVELISQIEEKHRVENPDIYVANKLPYIGSDFEMNYDMAADGKITFTVRSSDFSGSELQRKVATWLLSLGLTIEQINSLTIEY